MGASTTLVGRNQELALGRQLVDDVRHGRGTTVVVEGEPGVGKSRLAEAWVATAEDAGVDVVVGSCDELERERPFGVLLRTLGVRVDPDAGRFAVIDQIADVVDQRTLQRPLLLIVEDLHWADPATPLALHRLIPRSQQAGLLVVLTARPVPRTEQVDRLLEGVERLQGRRLSLPPLESHESRELVTALAGAPPGPRLLERVDRAAGNPLYVTELVRALLGEGSLIIDNGSADIARGGTPRSMRRTVLRHVSSLSPAAADVIRTAAMLGTAFSVTDLALVTAERPSVLIPSLDEALAAGVLVERGDRLAFRHDLVRDAVYEDQPQSVRKALHREIADRLAAAGAAALMVATHYRLGATAGDEHAVTWLRRAAAETETQDPATAGDLLGHALRLLPKGDPRRPAVLADEARLRFWSGRLADAEGAARAALELDPTESVEWTARGVLSMTLGLAGRVAEAIEQRRVLEVHPRSNLERTTIDVLWGGSLFITGDIDAAHAGVLAGLAAAERLDEPALVASASADACLFEYLRGNLEAAIAFGRRSVAIDVRSFEFLPDGWTSGYNQLAAALWDADQLEESEAALQARRQQVTRSGAAFIVPQIHYLLAARQWYGGFWDDAVAEVEAGLTAADELGIAYMRPTGVAIGTLIAAHRDDTARVSAWLDLAANDEAGGAMQGWEWWLIRHARGQAAMLRGDRDYGLAQLREAWSIATMVEAVAHYRLIGPDLIRALVGVGEPDEAAAVAAAVSTAAERAGGVASADGAALRSRALVTRDPALMLEAVQRYRESPRRFERASAIEDAGQLCWSSDRRDEALTLLHEARAEYDSLGAVADVRRVESALRAAGVRFGQQGSRRRPTSGWGSLTPTETEIVRLVCEGRTNRQVADHLHVSTRTVDTHMAHVFQKLGVRSRVELATHQVQQQSG